MSQPKILEVFTHFADERKERREEREGNGGGKEGRKEGRREGREGGKEKASVATKTELRRKEKEGTAGALFVFSLNSQPRA